MANIFNIESNKNIVQRLEQLTATTQPSWGKMSVGQMLLHAQKPLDVCEGKLILKRGLIGILFGKWAKNDFLKKEGFKKNLPTAPAFKITEWAEFEKEKEALISQIIRFREKGPSIIKNLKHPFFGEMSIEEWGILQYKHLDHHLKQFGV